MHDVHLDSLQKVAAWQHEMSPSPIEPWIKWLAREDHGPEYWWQHRERKRAEMGFVPTWAKDAKFRQFYIRCSASDPMKIAYTPDVEFGRQDRQIKTTPGRFLKKHFPSYSDDAIRQVSDTHRQEFGPPCVDFAFDSVDIYAAYNEGPHSCMSSQQGVLVYDGPDTVLAVLKKGSRITARTVVRIDRTPMEFTRVYGDAVMLSRYLTRLGFKAGGNLEGVRLRLHIENKRVMCPYTDTVQTAKRAGEFLLLGKGGVSSQQTGSWLPLEVSTTCHCCEEELTDSQAARCVLDAGGHNICSSCRSAYYKEVQTSVSGRVQWMNIDSCILIGTTWYWDNTVVLNHLGFVRAWGGGAILRTAATYIPGRDTWALTEDTCIPVGCSLPYLKSDCRQVPDGRWRKKAPTTEKELA